MKRLNWLGREVIDEDELFVEVFRSAVHMARKLWVQHDQAEDIASEVTLSLYKRKDNLIKIIKEKGQEAAAAYVRVAVRNQFIKLIKDEDRQRRILNAVVLKLRPENSSSDFSGRLTDKILLQRALAELKYDLCVVAFMHLFEGKSLMEIHKELEIPYGTARSRLRKALAELKIKFLIDQDNLKGE